MQKTTIIAFFGVIIALVIAIAVPVRFAKAVGTIVTGDVIRAFGSNSVYYVDSFGKRHPFPSDKTYFTWFPDFSKVKQVSAGQLKNFPIGTPILYRPGARLIKVRTDPRVYAVDQGGMLRWITSEQVAQILYGKNWSQWVDDMPDVWFSLYNVGDDLDVPLYPNGTLIRYSYEPQAVYLIEDNLKRHVRSESVFRANRFQWRHVVLVTSPDVYYYDGEPITGFEARLSDVTQNRTTGRVSNPYVLVERIPDVTQPPTNTLGFRRTDNFSAPIAVASLLEFWESIEHHPYAQGVTAGVRTKTVAEYLGYFMDTNNAGSSLRYNTRDNGTVLVDIVPGIQDYLNWEGNSPSNYGFPVPRRLTGKTSYNSWNVTTEEADGVSTTNAWKHIKESIDSDVPVLVTFAHWNVVDLDAAIDTIAFYGWGQATSEPRRAGTAGIPNETWFSGAPTNKSVGHSSVVVGYIEDFSIDERNDASEDWLIVHDTWSGTPSLMAVPWFSRQSAIWLATTFIVPAQSRLPSSPNLDVISTNVAPGDKISLTWNRIANASQYELQIDETGSFRQPQTIFLGGAVTNFNAPTRQDEERYYYFRIRSRNDVGVSGWSFTKNAYTKHNINTPVLTVSSSGDVVSGQTVRFSWTRLSNIRGYHLHNDTDSSFSNAKLVSFTSDKTSYDFIAPNVTATTNYYFRIRGYNQNGNGNWSNVVKITIKAQSGTASVPVLQGPSGLTTGQNITLSWNLLSGATEYHIQVDSSTSFNTVGNTYVNASNDNTFEYTPFTTTTRYFYFRARAVFGNTIGAWSASFPVLVKAQTITLTGPSSVISGTTFTVNWSQSEGASGYHLQYGTDSSFNAATLVTRSINERNFTVTPPLFMNGYYYFRARPYSSSGNGEWSNVLQVYVRADHAPSVQGPTTEIMSGQEFTITWVTIPGASEYQIQVDTRSDFATASISIRSANETSFSYIPVTSTGKYYYVRVRGSLNNNVGDWSETLNIYVKPTP